ncbi:MAG: GTP cyclohydrolase II [Myxococcota bacterium]|nr:GTP cyclohydrolase II [Myxococcota bacterium]
MIPVPHSSKASSVVRYSEANVPTEHGTFRVVVYREDLGRAGFHDHVAVVKGDVRGDEVLVRVHSECMTGEVLHSMKCDCREQLDFALQRVAAEGRGAVLYLRQEGRGIGLGDKIRAYALQERGVDTVDANRMLGLPDDSRSYDVAAFMCADLGIRSLALLTNNPLKVSHLRAEGVPVVRRVPVHIEPNEHNRGYLIAKTRRMGHHFDLAELIRSPGVEIVQVETADGEPSSTIEADDAVADDTNVRSLRDR